jgi:hypothetical protein
MEEIPISAFVRYRRIETTNIPRIKRVDILKWILERYDGIVWTGFI